MGDPMANRNALYSAQYDQISALFMTEEDTDWPQISRLIDQALRDPFLPHWHRAEFEAIWACEARSLAEEHIQRAKDAIEDMRHMLLAQDKDDAHITERLAPPNEMVATVESDLAESSDSEGQGKEAAPGAEAAREQDAAPSAAAGIKRK